MKREWKPGDVALVELPDGSEHPAVLIGVVTGCLCWHLVASGDFRCLDFDAVTARPVAVIDPDDRQQVERFREIASRWADQAPYDDDPGDLNYTTAMQAALREYADPKPPRPEEPTGRYAVVVDDEGREWLRTGWDYGMDKPWQNEATHAHWQAVDAVRVLSEGVTE